MANYSIKADLMKVSGAFVTNIQGKTMVKKCLCIPIEGSGLFLGEKGCYLSMTAIEMQAPRFEDTHCVKVSYDKEDYDRMTPEQRQALPIIGGLRPMARQSTPVQAMPATEVDDLPF